MIDAKWHQILSLDVPPILTAAFAATCCALLGNFLLLRRLSLMGDAISHAVLPGIVVAFLISGSRASLPVFWGAAGAGLLSAVLIELVRKFGRIESGAAMGVVFSIFFATGVLLMEQAAARSVDLDADCLLHGQLESIFWFPPHNLSDLLRLSTLITLPEEVITSFLALVITVGFIVVLYKELKLSSFDPALGTSLGFHAGLLHYLLMVLVAAAVVVSFKAVGSILVIAMIICPAATARFCTDRLLTQIFLSAIFAITSSILGYTLGAFGPIWLGWSNSVSTAGMITVVSGVFLGGAALFAPQYGFAGRFIRQIRLTVRIAREDLLGLLYRLEESKQQLTRSECLTAVGGGLAARLAARNAMNDGQLRTKQGLWELSDMGRSVARNIVRTHRLWETYLVQRLGLRVDHVHNRATELEHFTSDTLSDKLAERQEHPPLDPHGKQIPDKS